jgi:hypothetical protein
MKNRHEEKAAEVLEAIRPLLALLEELAATTPPEPPTRLRYLRKATPAVIRRAVAGLRSGEMRPIDSAKDANAVADAIEAEMERLLGLERLVGEVGQTAASLSSMIDEAKAQLLANTLGFCRELRRLARTTGSEELKEQVNRMERAVGRGGRR